MLFFCFKVLCQLTWLPAGPHSLAKDSEAFTSPSLHPWPCFCSVPCVSYLLSQVPPSQETPAMQSSCLENALLAKLSQAISPHCLSLLGALPGALTALIVVSFNPFVYPSDPLLSPCFSRISISGTRQTPVCQLSELVSLGSGFTVATLRTWRPGLRPLLTRPVYTAQLRSRGRYVGHRGAAWVPDLTHPLVHCVLRTTL